jgi:hypothetical protein
VADPLRPFSSRRPRSASEQPRHAPAKVPIHRLPRCARVTRCDGRVDRPVFLAHVAGALLLRLRREFSYQFDRIAELFLQGGHRQHEEAVASSFRDRAAKDHVLVDGGLAFRDRGVEQAPPGGDRVQQVAVPARRRSPVLPNVPTLAEAGVQGAEVYSWQGVVAPKGLPQAIKDKLAAAAIAGMRDPAVARQFTEQGMEVVATTPAELAEFQAREYLRWKKLIESRKITID